LRLATPSSIALSTSACETPSGRSSWPALRLPPFDVGAELGQLGDERWDDQRQQHGEQRDPGHDDEQGRRALVHPAVAQAVRERHEQRREQEHPPRDRRGDDEAARDAVRRPGELTGQSVAARLRRRLCTRHPSHVRASAWPVLPVQTF
jgi:hypothetical protein